MSEFLTRLNFGEMMSILGILVVFGGLFIGFVAVAGGVWSDVRKKEILAGLKHDMLERGMSADEIQKVLDAGTKSSGKVARESHAECCG
jgi:hypothetical protein